MIRIGTETGSSIATIIPTTVSAKQVPRPSRKQVGEFPENAPAMTSRRFVPRMKYLVPHAE